MNIDQLKEEIKFILKGLKENSLSGKELAKGSILGALITSLAGAGIGVAIGSKKKNGKRRIGKGALWGAGIGALSGAAAVPIYAQLRKYLDGVPFKNDDFELTKHNPGDKIYIGISGSANGENESWFADEMRSKFPGKTYMLRHVDGEKLKQKYEELLKKKLDITIVGHSSGGATASKFLKNNPSAKGYLIDPVSWTGRGSPTNSVIFTSDRSTRHGGVFENTIADIGGRWNEEGSNSVVFKGSHSNRIRQILRDFVSKGINDKNRSLYWPEYVTSMFGERK